MRGDDDRQAEMLLAVTPISSCPPTTRSGASSRSSRPCSPGSRRFDEMYAMCGRPSIPPEHLLKASLLIALFSVRSERQFCERLQYDLLFKWFLDLNVGDPAFNPTTFSKNRERLLRHQVADAFFAEVVAEAQRRRLLSAEHFTVDGTLLEAWASVKSYRPRDGQDPPATGGGRNPAVDFRGQRRSRETHVSTTDPEARLYPKGSGQAAKLCYIGHVLSDNRHGLVVEGHADAGRRLRRAGGGAGHARPPAATWSRHAGRGPRLRHARLRGRAARAPGHAARRAEPEPPPQRRRRAHHRDTPAPR
jgi:transposase